MLTNMIGNFLGKMVGKRLDGYKTQIGAVGLVLYALVLVVGKIWPDAGLPGAEFGWDEVVGIGSAGLMGLGVLHKAYKAGLVTPVPSTPVPGTTLATADEAMGKRK